MTIKQLIPSLSLLDDGELQVEPDLIKVILDNLTQTTKSKDYIEATAKIRLQLTKVRIKTQFTYYPDVFSAPEIIVKNWARSIGLISVPGLYSDIDLEKGTYEGGFKVWESTRDLVTFLTENQNFMEPLLRSQTRFRILELGAGSSLASLALLSRIIEDPEVGTDFRIHIQDYNWQVLASLSLINFVINLHPDYMEALIRQKFLRLFSGDWKNFRKNSNYKYNLIMMSEVIYSSDNYEALHNLLERHIKSSGYIAIATKDTYFGLTGGLYAWLDYVETRKSFRIIHRIQTIAANIPRSIIVMSKRDT